MPIQVVWDNDARTIIRWDFAPGWTWNAHREAMLLTIEMLATVPQRVDCIQNLHRTSMPMTRDALSQWKRLMSSAPDNLGMVIAVEADPFLGTMADIFQRLMRGSRHPIGRAATVEEARALIAELA